MDTWCHTDYQVNFIKKSKLVKSGWIIYSLCIITIRIVFHVNKSSCTSFQRMKQSILRVDLTQAQVVTVEIPALEGKSMILFLLYNYNNLELH